MSSSKTTRVYLGKIPLDTREREIEQFFKNYGAFHDINIKSGFAFIEFDDKRDAEDAVYDLDGKDFLGGRCVVELAKGIDRTKDRYSQSYNDRGSYSGGYRSGNRNYSSFDRPYNTQWRVIIENLSTRTNWRDLKDYFRRVGEVTFADAHRTREGEGAVDFKSKSEMEAAVRKLDDSDLDGRRIRVIATPKDTHRSRSRSRTPRQRSYSRSPPRRRRSRS